MSVEAGGVSAQAQAELFSEQIDAVQQQLASLNEVLAALVERRRAWQAGGDGERRVVELLARMAESGWRILPDRRWPGTAHANIDVLLVGPGGVFVVDVKNWAEPRVEGGRLWRGEEPVDDVDTLLAQAAAVEGILAELGLPATEVVPLLVLARRRHALARLGRVELLGDHDLPTYLLRRGVRLDASHVDAVSGELDRACPPMPAAPAPAARARGRHARPPAADAPVATAVRPDGEQLAMLDTDDVWADLVEVAAREPIEAWMTWLHPMQAKLANRPWSGPARIRGAAGTGKTVVALHRARHLARRSGRRVLFTSFVRTLPSVHRSLMRRMDPTAADLIDFVPLHAWARRLLNERGTPPTLDPRGIERCFDDAWRQAGVSSVLASTAVDQRYWSDEIAHVIKGRGLTSFDAYRDLARIGRRTPLQRTQREAVWALFAEYERLRAERGLHDWADLLVLVRDSLRAEPHQPGYAAVVVDEVQDLSCVGVQVLHELVGDRPDGLLLVGDGQQSVYPGGFTLAEAGVSVTGRAVVLDRNYRNGDRILRRALEVVAADAFDDLDVDPAAGAREVTAARPGGKVVDAWCDDDAGQRASLLTHLVDAHRLHGARWGDMAVLCASNRAVEGWVRVLQDSVIPAMRLLDYDGRNGDQVKVGTYLRAKGLEFSYVFVPDVDAVPRQPRPDESAGAASERAALERRQLFVAMTRARDGLWLGHRSTC